ncbi:Calx-beta domain-containing protein [Bremerella sp. T1]|uniref:Calx-beta domain-containing protein n=1 Tax=Bremerella sp. TYQ1 TaxID=3119568 RepID=UPI001CCA6D08|nr:Calx-beta domain-containing protein [Bremerella volcania]UBM36612.1 choice-of-anchor D domain-containing protein [Bremerella volcania]
MKMERLQARNMLANDTGVVPFSETINLSGIEDELIGANVVEELQAGGTSIFVGTIPGSVSDVEEASGRSAMISLVSEYEREAEDAWRKWSDENIGDGDRGRSDGVGSMLALEGEGYGEAEIDADFAGTPILDGAYGSFGTVAIGGSASRSVVIRNTGDAALSISGISISGSYSVSGNTGSGTLNPGQSRTLTVSMTGTSTAGTKTGTLSVSSNDSDENPFDIHLYGDVVKPTASISGGSSSLVEGNSDTYTISLNMPAAQSTNVYYTMNTGSASTSDFSPTSGSYVTIPAGQTSATVNISALNDTLVESTENFSIQLTSGSNYSLGGSSSKTISIYDTDEWTISVTAIDSTAEESGGNTGKFRVSRSGASNYTSPITVALNVSGSATYGNDYGFSLGTYNGSGISVTIPSGQTYVDIVVTPANDGIREGSETVTLQATSGTKYTAGSPSSATVTIEDNDDWTVSLSAADSTASEEGPSSGYFVVTRSGSPDLFAPLTVYVSRSGTATNGVDYATISSAVTIPAYSSSAYIYVNPINDNKKESSETVQLSLAGSSGYQISGSSSGTVTIEDNDDWTVDLVVSDTSAHEENASTEKGQVTLTRSGETDLSNPLPVSLSFSGSTAISGVDYVTIPSTYTIPAGQTSVTIDVTAINDAYRESDEDVYFTLASNSTYYNQGSSVSGNVTIGDNDDWVVALVVTGSTAEEGGTAGSFYFTRTSPGGYSVAQSKAISVGFSADSMASTASAGDYSFSSSYATFADGSATSNSISVNAVNDNLWETTEYLEFDLTPNSTYFATGSPSSGNITILDNDQWDVSAIAGGNAAETEDGKGTQTFTITRSGESDKTHALSVGFTLSGDADYTTDYTLSSSATLVMDGSSGTITIPSGETEVTITLTPVNDALQEEEEEVVLTIVPKDAVNGAAGGYESTGGPASMYIYDNDQWEVDVTLTGGPAQETPSNNATQTFTITRTGETDKSHPLDVYFSWDGSATVVDDYTLTASQTLSSGLITIPAGLDTVTITVHPVNDDLREQTETVELKLTDKSTTGTAGYSTTTASQTIEIEDNDDWAVTIEATEPTAQEMDQVPGEFTVTRSGESDLTYPLTVYLDISGTATHASDYSLSPIESLSGSQLEIVIPAGETTIALTLTPEDEGDIEGDETAILTIVEQTTYGTPGYTGSGSDTVTIEDRKEWDVTIKANSPSEIYEKGSDGATKSSFTFTRSNLNDFSKALDLTVEWGGYATNGTDYKGDSSSLPSTITIPADEASVTIIVEAINDTKAGVAPEKDEDIRPELIAPTEYPEYRIVGDTSAYIWIVDTYVPPGNPGCSCSCGCAGQTMSESNSGSIKTGGGNVENDSSATQKSQANIEAQVRMDAGSASAERIQAVLTVNGNQVSSIHFDPSTATLGDTLRFAQLADTSSLDSGFYDWTMDIIDHYSDETTRTRTYHGKKDVYKAKSGFGDGWRIPESERLIFQSDGITWERGTGNLHFFSDNGDGTYTQLVGDFNDTELVENVDGSFTISQKSGVTFNFSSAGLVETITDRNGNESTFSYIDADSDSQTDDLSQITASSGKTKTYTYTSGKITQVTDFDGTVTNYQYDANGRLEKSITPDPDGTGTLSDLESVFGYNTTTGQLTSYTSPKNETTTFNFDANGLYTGRTNPDSSQNAMTSWVASGLPDTSGGKGTEGNEADLVTTAGTSAKVTDEEGKEWEYRYGTAGRVTEAIDPNGAITYYEYNDIGQIAKLTQPDPDGSGPETEYVTTYEYDDHGNRTKIIHSDSSEEIWTYNSSFAHPISYIDRNGKKTLYTLDAKGNVETVQQVIGFVDGVGNSETDDITIEYDYTPAPSSSSDPPEGLVSEKIDGIGRVTQYSYNGQGDLTKITFAVGTIDEAYVEFKYDSNGWLTDYYDELGQRTQYEYYTDGMLKQETLPDPDGAGLLTSPIYSYQYDGNGNLVEQTDPLGRITTYTYDDVGNLTKITLPDHDDDGNLTNYEYLYNDSRQLTGFKDALGVLTEYAYDGLGQLLIITLADPDGIGPLTASKIEYEYDSLGRVTSMLDQLGRETTYNFSDFGNKSTANYVDPDGTGPLFSVSSKVEYDAVGNMLESSYYNQAVQYEYDDLHRLIKVTYEDPDGAGQLVAPERSYQYDDAHQLRFVTDELGNVTEYQYDNRGRLKTIIHPDPDGTGELASPTESMLYDDAGQLTSYTDELGNTTSYVYDDLGRLESMTLPDPDGAGNQAAATFNYTYDAVGNLLTESDAFGKLTCYEYDDHDNLIEITYPDPDGTGSKQAPVESFEYDDNGRLILVVDAAGNETAYEYDDLGRLVKVTLPDPDDAGEQESPVYIFEYDLVGNLISETDSLGNVTSYEYDNLDRLTTITSPDPDGEGGQQSPVERFVYDIYGNLKEAINPRGLTTTYQYDNLNRLTSVTEPDPDGPSPGGSQTSPVSSYQYDAAGNVTSFTDANGNTTAYQYDHLQRLTLVVLPDPDGVGGETSPQYQYKYDAASNVTKVIDPLDRETTYEYDDLQQLVKITQPDPDGVGGDSAPVFSFVYDAQGRLKKEIDARSAVTEYFYDHLGRLTSVTTEDPDGGGSQTAATTAFDYDILDRLISRTDPLGKTTTYDYDNLGRLIEEVSPITSVKMTYTYDSEGNLLAETDGLGHTTSYVYDNLYRTIAKINAEGRITEYAYDANGNLLSLLDPAANLTTWAYDGLDRVTQETNELNKSRYYEYDAVGNVVEQTDRNGDVIEYDYDNLNRLVTERWKDGTTTVETFNYVYDAASQLTSASGSSSSLSYVYDNLGRVKELTQQHHSQTYSVDQTFDAMGNRLSFSAELNAVASVVNTFAYDLLGRMTSVTQTGTQTDKMVEFAYNKRDQLLGIDRYEDATGTTKFFTTDFQYDDAGRVTDIDHEALDDDGYGGPSMGMVDSFDFGYDAASRITTLYSYGGGTVTFQYDDSSQLTYEYSTGTNQYGHYNYDQNGNRVRHGYTVGKNNQLLTDGEKLEFFYDGGDPSKYRLQFNIDEDEDGYGGFNPSAGPGAPVTDADFYAEEIGNQISTSHYVNVNEGTETVVESTIGDGSFLGNDVDFYRFSMGSGDTIGIDVDALLMDDGTQLGTANIRLRLFDYLGNQVAYNIDGIDPDNNSYSNDPYLVFTSYSGGEYYLGVSFEWHSNYDPLEPYEGSGTASNSYTYDDEGARTSKTDLSTGETTEYEWNHRHQLTKITEKDDLGNVTKIVEYEYDPLGRRIAKHIDNNGDGDTLDAGDDVDLFFYDGQHIALQTDESGNEEHHYLHGPAIDMILADEDATGEVLWAATDHLGSVTTLLDFDGTSDTDVVATFTYDAFGNVTDQTGSGVDFSFGYTGREIDAESDLQYNRARYYDADIGRWLSQDPISFSAGDENLYRYVGNTVTIYVDPSGLQGGDWLDWAASWNPGRGFGGDQYDDYFTWSEPFGPWNSNPTSSQPSNTTGPKSGTQASIRKDLAKQDAGWKASDEQMKERMRDAKDAAEDLQDHLGSSTPGVGQVKDAIEIRSGKRFVDGEELGCMDYVGRAANVGASGATIFGSADELIEGGGSAARNAGRSKGSSSGGKQVARSAFSNLHAGWYRHIDGIVDELVASGRPRTIVLGEGGQGKIASFVNRDPRKVTEFLEMRPRNLDYSDAFKSGKGTAAMEAETLEFNLALIRRLQQQGFTFEVMGDISSSCAATSSWLKAELEVLESLGVRWKTIPQSQIDEVMKLKPWGRPRR